MPSLQDRLSFTMHIMLLGQWEPLMALVCNNTGSGWLTAEISVYLVL